MARLDSASLLRLAARILEQAGCAPNVASVTAEALIYADLHGIASHGVARLPMYAAHLRLGRVNARAQPRVLRDHPAAMLIDAGHGLAFPACRLGLELGLARVAQQGSVAIGVTHSHHFGAGAWHLEQVAAMGKIGLAFSNAPASMPMVNGRRPIFGTNPIAAVFPRKDQEPLMIDLSLAQAARGKVMVAAREGTPIPPGWATDREGNPTVDPNEALEGMTLPFGGAKGAVLALMLELLCGAMLGARLGVETDTFLRAEGNQAGLGHLFWLIDPAAFAGPALYRERVETLITLLSQDPDVRLPGSRRREIAHRQDHDGIVLDDKLLAELEMLAEPST